MALVDFIIIIIITVLVVLGLIWGFVKIAIAMGTWIAASVISFTFAPHLSSSLLTTVIESDPMRLAAAMGILFVLTLMVGAVVSFLVRQFISKTGLTGLDRVLGMVVGATLGLVIVTALVFIAGLTRVPSAEWWQTSLLIEHFETLAIWLQGYLPVDVARNFSY